MKKIISFLLFAAALFAAGACSDDKLVGSGTVVQNIVIDSASVNFTDAPGTGRILIGSAQSITRVESTSDWCTATVEGNAIVIRVTQNRSLVGRAAELTIWSGSDSRQVTVQQLGLPDLFLNGDTEQIIGPEAGTFTLPLTSPAGYPITASTEVSWLKVSTTDGVIRITAEANPNRNFRNGEITFTSGPRGDRKVVNIAQGWNVASELSGDWELCYYNGSDEENIEYYSVTLQKDSIIMDLGATYGRIAIPATVNTLRGTITIDATARCGGSVSGNTPFLFFGDPLFQYWSSYETSSSASAKIIRDEEGNLRADFSGYIYRQQRIFACFYFEFHQGVASGLPTNNNTRRSYWSPMYYPFLYKYVTSSATASAKASAKARQLNRK